MIALMFRWGAGVGASVGCGGGADARGAVSVSGLRAGATKLQSSVSPRSSETET